MLKKEQKIKRLLYICAVLLFACLTSVCKKDIVQNFPEDLLYEGLPVNACCVVATQFGDSSRLEPKSVTYREQYPEESDYKVIYYPEQNMMTSSWKYSDNPSDVYDCMESYSYIGSYKNKHIVLSRHHDTAGTGRFCELGLVTRDGDTLCNAGEIAAGDRACGGCIKIISLENNLLRFKQVATPHSIESIIAPETIFDPKSKNELPQDSLTEGFWGLYQVNLDDELLKPSLYGIMLLDDKGNYDHFLNQQHKCFCDNAKRYIEDGYKELDLAQTELFVKDVWQSIAQNSEKKKIVEPGFFVAQVFPQDLLYAGVPIHPLCLITAVQYKLPQPVSIDELQQNLPECYEVKHHTFSYDLEKKESRGSCKRRVDEDYVLEDSASYVYVGSYKNRHIIQICEHCYGSRHDTEWLVIVTREKDTICCAAEICVGNSYSGVTLKNNVLKFEESLPVGCIDSVIPRESIAGLKEELLSIANDLPFFQNGVRFGCFYEVDLDDQLLQPKLCGISFLGDHHYSWGASNDQEECFCEVAMKYIEDGHENLDLAQAQSFVKDVWESIAQKVAKNECV